MAQSLEIVVSCHNFQRRFNWMLSSIAQHSDDKIPELIINVAHVKGNGKPTCEELAEFFYRNHGIEFRLITYDNTEELQYRGLARNRQIKESKADWLLFADCDMVYTRTFLPSIKLWMDTHKDDKLYHVGRYSCDVDICDDIISKYPYPCTIPNPAEICSEIPVKEMANVGAGYFQLVMRKAVMQKNDGLYIKPEDNRDWSWERGQKAKSDKQFRTKFEHVKVTLDDLIKCNEFVEKEIKKRGSKLSALPVQFHLNHRRDNQVGHHIEEQR